MKRFVKILFLFSFLTTHYSLLTIAQVTQVEAIGITVSDMDRAVKFYSDALNFQKISDKEFYGSDFEKLEGLFGLHMRIVRMKLGDETIELTDYLTSGGRPIPIDTRSNDLWFQHIAIVVSDMDKAYEQLRKYNVEFVSTVPQTLPQSNMAAAGIKAFYFHDPDNHTLELIYFPKEKGNPKWQNVNGKLFLGVDHTAIGVSNTASSLKFYRDALGLQLKGESINSGIEQSRLNNVEDDSVHISGLRAESGPGVEFLEYLKPADGKPYPQDSRADDLISWHTTVFVDDAEAVYAKLQSLGYAEVSIEPIVITDRDYPQCKEFFTRDPDGHLVLVAQHEEHAHTAR